MLMETRSGDSSFPRGLLVGGPHAERLRRRYAAIAAAVVFVSCFLVALGFALLVPVALGLLALLAVVRMAYTRRWDRTVLKGARSRAGAARRTVSAGRRRLAARARAWDTAAPK